MSRLTKVAVIGSGNIGTDPLPRRRGLVGGQEDLLADIALDLQGARQAW